MVAYEFYRLDSEGRRQIIGVLPERRKYPERLTQESIRNWGKNFFRINLDTKDIFFIQVAIEESTGRIFLPAPFSIPRKEISK